MGIVLLYFFVAVQLAYALFFFIRIFSLPGSNPNTTFLQQPVSIVICAKNEAANLKKNLPSILAQRYSNPDSGLPQYEVIVVNDASEDDTVQVLMDLELRYDNLWDISISKNAERNLPGKKFALSKALEVAQHNWLLLTDADCAPAGDEWLGKMVAPLAKGNEIVAGYGGYTKGNGLLNAFIRWETLHTFMQYGTYALAGKPYMAVGRNLACTKDALLKAQNSPLWGALPSGDDDLLVSLSGNSNNTAVVCDAAAFTFTSTKASWKEWVAQKQRHLSTGKYYKKETKLLLGFYAATHAAMWLSFFVLLFSPYCIMAMKVMALRCMLYWCIWVATAVRLREKKLIYFFPLFDIAWMVYNFVFFPYITWKDKQNWK